MIRIHIIWLFLFCLIPEGFATHNRAGEITYRHLGGYTYELTITTYTYYYSPAKRQELTVSWGDGTTSVVKKVPYDEFIRIPNTDYLFNTYIATHTYPGAGIYEILMEDPNRNAGVDNIPNSVNTIFSIKTTMMVGSNIGSNNTPVLLNPPIDKAARGHIFIHNPAAYDPDGDSISYEITICTGAGGEPIEGYILPPATDTLLIDPVIGDLQWITPAEVGVYNIAIMVDEWRNNIRIGRIARDMQIDVYESDNNPPVNSEIPDFCVLAGDTIVVNIEATDADMDPVEQFMGGGPFQVTNPAEFEILSTASGYISSRFTWITDCGHARKQPYTVVLKTEDSSVDIPLVDITSFTIRVLHQAPDSLVAYPGSDTVRLEWDVSDCGTPAGYKIYRRLGSYEYTPDSCVTGLPAYTGYELLDYVTGSNTNYYVDDNLGNGLVPGYDYCYRITAFYTDGSESIPSEEYCTTLIAGTPPILRVSVSEDGTENGEIEVAWAVPLDLEPEYDGPYRYEVLRMAPGENDFTPVATIPSTDLSDTTFTDTGINTLVYPYTYSVVLYDNQDGNWIRLPGNETATSQYIEINGADNELTLNMKKRSPWFNQRYEVFRENQGSGIFESIGETEGSVFVDSGLRNNRTYTYRTVGDGIRPIYERIYQVQNTSHLASGIPVDTVPPCPPDLTVTSECDSSYNGFNELTWVDPEECDDDDIIAYIVYSRDSLYGEFTVLDTLSGDTYEYIDPALTTIEKCYAVTAIDSFYNESDILPFCVYNICSFYDLPNVFTPNADNVNDIYRSWNLNDYVKRVNMIIYNRYGKEVFRTENPDIDWDGRNAANGKLVSSGVYYYICDVYEPRITGTVVHNLTGFIHVYSGKDNIKLE
ncbi:MAG: gliding motility-associated C-terminal domain-containing protein [Bacteroidales bacterium]|jgi:gliding motility-associated-like protein